jgi:protein gp37
MNDRSAIEWTDSTWNPITGCTKISPGCAHCYAEAITLRFARGGRFLPGQTTIRMHSDRLRIPLKWRDPRLVFVNSMSDLFHEEVPEDFILQVFEVMREARQHTFQVLTKRHERLVELSPRIAWPTNVWMGVSVENQVWADRRIPALKKVPASVRFLSCEPLLGPVSLDSHLDGINWVIVGGESGAKARPVDGAWVRMIREQCVVKGVPFFFKQWGGRTSKANGRLLDGRTWDDMPNRAEAGLAPVLHMNGQDNEPRRV